MSEPPPCVRPLALPQGGRSTEMNIRLERHSPRVWKPTHARSAVIGVFPVVARSPRQKRGSKCVHNTLAGGGERERVCVCM